MEEAEDTCSPSRVCADVPELQGQSLLGPQGTLSSVTSWGIPVSRGPPGVSQPPNMSLLSLFINVYLFLTGKREHEPGGSSNKGAEDGKQALH